MVLGQYGYPRASEATLKNIGKCMTQDPRRPMITHTDPKSKQDKVKVTNLKKLPKIQNFARNIYTQHIFWSCLIRCIYMKWIQPEL